MYRDENTALRSENDSLKRQLREREKAPTPKRAIDWAGIKWAVAPFFVLFVIVSGIIAVYRVQGEEDRVNTLWNRAGHRLCEEAAHREAQAKGLTGAEYIGHHLLTNGAWRTYKCTYRGSKDSTAHTTNPILVTREDWPEKK